VVSEPLPEHLYNVNQVARYLGKSVPTIYRLLRGKRLRASKVGGEWRISDRALREFLEDGINV
jgi:excisionase family DNA binding protein